MFFYTDTADAPWTVIKSDDKQRARINALRHILNQLPYPNKSATAQIKPDPLIVGSAAELYEEGEHNLSSIGGVSAAGGPEAAVKEKRS
jgi:hypothetical protein